MIKNGKGDMIPTPAEMNMRVLCLGIVDKEEEEEAKDEEKEAKDKWINNGINKKNR